MFRSQGLRHLVVVNSNLEVQGMLTRKDFQKAGHMHHDHAHDHEHANNGHGIAVTNGGAEHYHQEAWQQPETQA